MNLYLSADNDLLMKRAIDLKKDFPALARELEGDLNEHSTWIPKVTDHLQRCSNEDEAIEIINFFEERGEISPEYARILRFLVVKKGHKIFGSRKPGEYEKGMREE